MRKKALRQRTNGQPLHCDGNVNHSTSRPIKPNSTALRISSISSQKRSRYSRVMLDMAYCRPGLPMTKPAVTMAIGPEVCRAEASA
jgi:hypothetical protein